MQLSQFVQEVLTEIVTGIRAAQAANGGSHISPDMDGGHDYAPNHTRFNSSARLKSTVVDFDIALTVETSTKAGGKAGLKVFDVGVDGGGERVSRDSTVSRVQFAVPLLLPKNERSWSQAGPDEWDRETSPAEHGPA